VNKSTTTWSDSVSEGFSQTDDSEQFIRVIDSWVKLHW